MTDKLLISKKNSYSLVAIGMKPPSKVSRSSGVKRAVDISNDVYRSLRDRLKDEDPHRQWMRLYAQKRVRGQRQQKTTIRITKGTERASAAALNGPNAIDNGHMIRHAVLQSKQFGSCIDGNSRSVEKQFRCEEPNSHRAIVVRCVVTECPSQSGYEPDNQVTICPGLNWVEPEEPRMLT